MINANSLLGSHDIVLITLDTLRFDVAATALDSGLTPNLRHILPDEGWQKRHSPGSFTFAAHQAFFAGFLPTPATPGPHPRLFALAFPGSETTTEQTCQFDAPNIVQGLADRGYHTVCIGGVGFFNKLTALGQVLPSMFTESHWDPSLGVTNANSTEHQFSLAANILAELPDQKRMFLFINVSALHQPNKMYVPGAQEDSPTTQAAALAYVDSCLPTLWEALQRRGPALVILTSDHGTTYGDDGYWGHRLAHPVVWEVPYAELILPASRDE